MMSHEDSAYKIQCSTYLSRNSARLSVQKECDEEEGAVKSDFKYVEDDENEQVQLVSSVDSEDFQYAEGTKKQHVK